jgi:hypothetical protein
MWPFRCWRVTLNRTMPFECHALTAHCTLHSARRVCCAQIRTPFLRHFGVGLTALLPVHAFDRSAVKFLTTYVYTKPYADMVKQLKLLDEAAAANVLPLHKQTLILPPILTDGKPHRRSAGTCSASLCTHPPLTPKGAAFSLSPRSPSACNSIIDRFPFVTTTSSVMSAKIEFPQSRSAVLQFDIEAHLQEQGTTKRYKDRCFSSLCRAQRHQRQQRKEPQQKQRQTGHCPQPTHCSSPLRRRWH